MKVVIFPVLLFLSGTVFSQPKPPPNIFIITTDGFRWQELFGGADSTLIHQTEFVSDTALLKLQFWDNNREIRKKKLLPFIWQTIQKQGALYGNREWRNHVSVANPYRLSYAGYNEIFTGYADPYIASNRKRNNTNENLLHFINKQSGYENKVAAFASWNLFDNILHSPQAGVYINSGYRPLSHDNLSATEILTNAVQQIAVDNRKNTRNDMLTFVAAKEYILTNHPKFVYIGFGETDEYAHNGRYDGYLQSVHLFDEYLAQLWYLVNQDPFYKNNTSFIITTDHGRGQKPGNWTKHGLLTPASNQTWLMTLGPLFETNGEIKTGGEILNEQLAQTIARLLGFHFNPAHSVAEPITLTTKQK